jgi:FAD/FMN-containing dehydrogenase/Fe-S oxidoreductase
MTQQEHYMPTSTITRKTAHTLADDIAHRISGEVRFDKGSRALYATDASNYRQVPIGVVVPRSIEDVVETVALCGQYGAAILPRGGGTSLAGQCCNVAVVIDCSKYLREVLEVDPDRKLARVQPGTVLDDLRAAAEQHHLTYGPDPATHDHCTLGGMIGNNSCGVHSIMAGMTSENVEELDILTARGLRMRVGRTSEDEVERIIQSGGERGEIYRKLRDLRDHYADEIRDRYPDIPRRVSGFNLPALLPENGFNVAQALVGSEGTCVTVLEATVRLIESPPYRTLVALGYDNVATACDHVPPILQHGPIGLEGFDDRMVDDMRKQDIYPSDIALLPEGGGWLLVEFGGDSQDESDAKARAFINAVKDSDDVRSTKLFDDKDEETDIWHVREAALGATAHVPGEASAWPGWEDSSVPPERMGDYLRDLRKLLDSYDYACSFYGHFGQGCLHTRIDFDLTTSAGIERFRAFMHDAAELVLRYGGSLSGEHGDGQSRAELLPMMFGDDLVQAFREFKAIWDPDGLMNPGKVVDPYRIDQNLRLGIDYNPPQPATHFQYPHDDRHFAQSTLRCVGVGKCRREGGGTMCPSYMVTHEEMHSTRGRARLLFEMLEGDPVSEGWRAEPVKEALDLCLACKGCKGDCPVHVDMATYKAEFLSHYYHRRLRPVTAYSMGLIFWWARVAALAPGLVNAVTHAPGISRVVKALGGIAPQRSVPEFAGQTFTDWFRNRAPRNVDKPPVILWPDTFNNHFHPESATAAVEVLEAAGFDVRLPRRHVCCGRPLYDFGMLDRAKHQLIKTMRTLTAEIDAGIPIVVLEPSCASVFKDELLNFFPDDARAQKLSQQVILLSEFLQKRDVNLPRLQRSALVHGHCHQKSIQKMSSEESVLREMGVSFTAPAQGCCGMAGAFGFEKDKYEVSLAIGELELLPAVRNAPPETLLIADGFSCREQIEQCTGRKALHLAEVIRMAMLKDERTLPNA